MNKYRITQFEFEYNVLGYALKLSGKKKEFGFLLGAGLPKRLS